MIRLALALCLLTALTPVEVQAVPPPLPAAPLHLDDADIPEVALQVKPSSYFFALKNPKDFKVARPESFQDLSQFKVNDLFYTVNAPLGTVFSKYLAVNPLKLFSNARSMVTAVYVPSLGRTLYRADLEQHWTHFEVGMNIFVDMCSLPVAITNKPAMMVALKIVSIDSEAKQVEFRYLEGTPSYGRQLITFKSAPGNPNVTEIAHRTWFRSYSAIIEKFYPMYHRMMINGMHARYRFEIEGESAP